MILPLLRQLVKCAAKLSSVRTTQQTGTRRVIVERNRYVIGIHGEEWDAIDVVNFAEPKPWLFQRKLVGCCGWNLVARVLVHGCVTVLQCERCDPSTRLGRRGQPESRLVARLHQTRRRCLCTAAKSVWRLGHACAHGPTFAVLLLMD